MKRISALLVLLLCLTFASAALAQDMPQVSSLLETVLAYAADLPDATSYYTTSNGWYLGMMQDKSPEGYGLWCNSNSISFGELRDGKFDGFCSTWYSDGRFLSGMYTNGDRTGEFFYAAADGSQYLYQYADDELKSHELLASKHEIPQLYFEQSDGCVSFGAVDAQGRRDGTIVTIQLDEGNARSTQAVSYQAGEPGATALHVAPDGTRAMQAFATPTPAATAVPTRVSDFDTSENALVATVNGEPYSFFLIEATPHSNSSQWQLLASFMALNPRGDVMYTLGMYYSADINGNYSSTRYTDDVMLYLTDNQGDTYESYAFGDAYYSGAFEISIQRDADWTNYTGTFRAAFEPQMLGSTDSPIVIDNGTFHFNIDDHHHIIFELLEPSSSGQSASNSGSSVSAAELFTAPASEPVIVENPCYICYTSGQCQTCGGDGFYTNSYTGDTMSCTCDNGNCSFCDGEGHY